MALYKCLRRLTQPIAISSSPPFGSVTAKLGRNAPDTTFYFVSSEFGTTVGTQDTNLDRTQLQKSRGFYERVSPTVFLARSTYADIVFRILYKIR